MITEKQIQQYSEELKPIGASFLIFVIPPIIKEGVVTTMPQSASPDDVALWYRHTNYHPARGIVIAVGPELQGELSPGDCIYFARKMTLQPFIYDGFIFHRGWKNDIITIVKSERGKEYQVEEDPKMLN